MFSDLIVAVSVFIEEYGIIAVFLLCVIEEIIAPIPSSLVLLAAGFFLLPASQGFGDVFFESIAQIVTPASFGLTLGSLLVYSVAYLGGRPAIQKWGKWFGISWQKVERAEKRIAKGHTDEILLFALRAIPVIPSILISIVSGVVRFPVKIFISTTFLGSAVRALFMSLVGWSVGEAYLAYADRFANIGDIILYGLVGIIVLWGLWLFIKKKFNIHKAS